MYVACDVIMAEIASETLNYNRSGWQLNYTLRQQEQYQRQKMRVRQVELYREDLRALFGLTVGKMDNYTIVNSLMLGITSEMFFKGRMPPSTPSWLFWCWGVSVASSMYYFLLSLWLALHASVLAQTFATRALTQWLRLPIPSAREVREGAAKLEDFEKENVGGIFRVPVLQADKNKGDKEIKEKSDDQKRHDLTTEWDLFQRHFLLFNKLHDKWQGYEAYARVCMSFGINQLFSALGYFALSYYAVYYNVPFSGWAFVILFQTAAQIHAKCSFNLSRKSHYLMVLLLQLPALFTSVAVIIVKLRGKPNEVTVTVFASMSILGHFLWCLFCLFKTWSDKNGLPLKFSTVWCVDVLGFGLTTLTEVQEPKAVNPLRAVKTFLAGGPTNTYLREDVPETEGSGSLRVACKKVENTLQRLFAQWGDGNLTAAERVKLEELREIFENERRELADVVNKEESVEESADLLKGWVRLYYSTDDGIRPYYVQVNTGELKWELPDTEETVKRGPSLLPEQLAIFENTARAYQEAQNEQSIGRFENKHSIKRNQIPFTLYKFGTIVIMIVWSAALTDTIYQGFAQS